METSDVQMIRDKATALITEKARSVVIAVYNDDGSVAIHPFGNFAEHILMGEMISRGGMDMMLKPKTPANVRGLFKGPNP